MVLDKVDGWFILVLMAFTSRNTRGVVDEGRNDGQAKACHDRRSLAVRQLAECGNARSSLELGGK